ncbi:glycosyl hydrolase 53 family protein [Paenibacillus sp. FSL R5-192]|uniref:glycosyl hydrolase 53 family protein n=1 Tax=Paenibacillus sp. FSL R5-192 TaxID=1226754 RepID=UPI0012EBAD3A|nr:glycosyl hydrolase 53 family protein [Paenibacillus sp. FSL R5-192]
MNKRYISGCLVLLMLFCDLGLMVRPAAAEDAKVNVALNKAVTVSTEYLEWESKKEHLVDGKSDTHWTAKAGVTSEQPQWAMIDLGEDYNLSGAEITWRENTVVKYRVETSADQQAWTNVADLNENADPKQIADLTFQQNDVRYIRLNISFYKGEGVWPEILEFKVWGEAEGTEPANIKGYDEIEVRTVTRRSPILPNEVKAQFQNEKSGMVPVTWDHIDPMQYASAGEFTVTGVVYGAPPEPQLKAKVIVEGYRADYVRGVDISTLTAIEDKGGKYVDSNGTERDLLDILKDRGVNYIRLRLWNDPQKSGGYNDKDDVIRLAERVKKKGMKILLDFHYSDEWAHPGQQLRPKAWEGLSPDELKKAVYDYTYEVVREMKAEGAMPDMVQIGNEINSGVLNGLSSDVDFEQNVALLKSGVDAVRAVEGGDQVQIMIHLAEGGKADTFDWYFSELEKRELKYDIIGLSYYPFWHGTFADVQKTMNEVSDKFKKDVIIAETSYPFSYKNGDAHGNIIGSDEALHVGGADFPATVQGQYDAIAGIMDMIANVPDNHGAGFFYWEPAWIPAGVGWIASEGNAWENQAMFDYDEFPANGGHSYEGRALWSLDVYKRGLSLLPADRQQLDAALTRAKSLVQTDFTPESWVTLAPAISAANDVYQQAYTPGGVTQSDTDAATTALERVMQQMQVIAPQLDELRAKIAEARTYQQTDWSAATWAVLTKALEGAEQVVNDPRATQTDANTAVKRLHDAIQGLSNVDKTQLHQYIQQMHQQTKSSYTRRSWSVLEQSLQAAIQVRDNNAVVQSEVNSALSTLKQAFTNLVSLEALTTGKTATASSSAGTGGNQANSPEGAIDNDPNTSWGTDKSIDSLWQVDLGQVANLRKIEMSMWSGGIKYTIEVSNDNKNFVKVVDTTSDVVVSTAPSHVLPEGTEGRYIRVTIKTGPTWVGFMEFEAYGTFPADKTALQATVDAAEKLKQTEYTTSSWNVFSKALSEAKAFILDVESSMQDVSNADRALQDAVSKLVRQDVTPGPGQPSEPSVPSQPSNPGTAPSTGNPSVTPPVGAGTAPEKGSITLKGTTAGDEKYSIRPDASQLTQALQSMDVGNRTLKLIADVPDRAKTVTFQLAASQLAAWVRSEEVQSLDVVVGQTTVRVPLRSLPLTIAETEGTFDIVVAKGSTDTLSTSQKAAIGNHAIVDVNLLMNNKPLQWTNRAVEVALSNVEQPKKNDVVMVVHSISTSGEMKPVTYSKYDDKTKTMTFKPLESSSYVIAEVEVPLNDLQNHIWALQEVQNLYGKGIITGMSATRFAPQGELTRAQFLQMIIKGIGDTHQPDPSISVPTDVKEGQWYANSVRLGIEMNIIQGRADGSFGANERISREDMAVMLNRALKVVQHDQDATNAVQGNMMFVDNTEISAYAKEAVASMQQLGLLNGMPDGTFAPKETANRAQGAVAVARMMEQLY